jgi:hypothetical protein
MTLSCPVGFRLKNIGSKNVAFGMTVVWVGFIVT